MQQQGNYANCQLKEATTTTSKAGKPMMVLTFDIGEGVARTVRFMLDEDKVGKDGKTNFQRATEQLARIGFDGNFEEPKFAPATYDPGITLNCKHQEWDGKMQEQWSLAYSYEPADKSTLSALSRNYRATQGVSKPASRPAPTTTPAKPASAPSRARPGAAKTTDTGDVGVDVSGVHDADTAFSAALAAFPALSDQTWSDSIAQHEKDCKRKEKDFNVNDWKQVAELCVIPF